MSVLYTRLEALSFIKNPSLKKINLLSSVPVPQNCGMIGPRRGLTFIYGVSSLKEFDDFLVEDAFDSVIEKRKESVFLPCRIKIMAYRNEEDSFFSGHHIDDTSTLDLRRLSKTIENEVLSFFEEKSIQKYGKNYVESLGCYDQEDSLTYRIIEFFPEFIDDLVLEKSWMRKISTVIWNARAFSVYDVDNKKWIEEGVLKTRITVLNTDNIVFAIPNSDKYIVEVPHIIVRKDFYDFNEENVA